MHVAFPPAYGPQLLGKTVLFHLKRLGQVKHQQQAKNKVKQKQRE